MGALLAAGSTETLFWGGKRERLDALRERERNVPISERERERERERSKYVSQSLSTREFINQTKI